MKHNCKIDSKLCCKASEELERTVALELQIPDPQESKANLDDLVSEGKDGATNG